MIKNFIRSQILSRVLFFETYNLIHELWIIIRWSLLKSFAILICYFLGDDYKTEKIIIRIGNLIFKRTYNNSLYQDYNSYVHQYGIDTQSYFMLLSPEEWLTNRTILDLGSGLGQYSALLHQLGAQEVISLEYQYNKVSFGVSEFNLNKSVNASAEAIPLKTKTFDTIFSHTVFEHLPDVEASLSESVRVLKDNGYILLSYNFFHHRGGHHLFPYIHFPWATWVVKESSLCKHWTKMLAADQKKGEMLFYPLGCELSNLTDGSEIGLNKLKYDQFESIVKRTGLEIYCRTTSEKIGHYLPFLLTHPTLKYFLSGTIFYVLRKNQD